MVLEVPPALVSTFARADDVLKLFTGSDGFDETSVAGDTIVAPDSLVIGEDLRLVGLIVRNELLAEEGTTGQTNPGGSEAAPIETQISTRSDFAALGGDLDVPAGVFWQRTLTQQAHPAFEDETNQSGGMGQSAPVVVEDVIPADIVEIEATQDLDEGTEIQVHYRLEGVPDGRIQIETEAHWFVQEV